MPTPLRFRIPAELRDYFSILSTGLHLVQSTGRLPEPPEGDRVRMRVALADADLTRVDHIAKVHGVSRNEAVVAALVWATMANVYPKRSAPKPVTDASPETSSAPRRTGSHPS